MNDLSIGDCLGAFLRRGVETEEPFGVLTAFVVLVVFVVLAAPALAGAGVFPGVLLEPGVAICSPIR